jgi:hypothetical protein
MQLIPLTRFVSAFCVSFTLGMAPSAAQTTTGTMVPVQNPGNSAPAATAPVAKPPASLSKSVEFTTLASAAAHCPNSTVVWSTLSKSHSFHTSGSRYFGKTKHGAYVCKDDALTAGFHQAKS